MPIAKPWVWHLLWSLHHKGSLCLHVEKDRELCSVNHSSYLKGVFDSRLDSEDTEHQFGGRCVSFSVNMATVLQSKLECVVTWVEQMPER